MSPEEILSDPAVAAALDARAAQTGRDRAEYEDYITAPPREGSALTAEEHLQARLHSLQAGPPPRNAIEQLQAMTATVLPAQHPAA